MNFLYILIILILLYIIKSKNLVESFHSKRVCNDIDSRCYRIASHYDNMTHNDASKLLAELHLISIKLIKYVRDRHINSPDYKKREIVRLLLERYNAESIIENSPYDAVNTSYVKNKGDVFAICLREKLSGNNNFHDRHLIEFVLIHELSHLADKNWGHKQSFWETFKFLLKEAKSAGIHDPVDYSKHPENYCYLDLTSNPYFNNRIKDI